MKHDMLTDPMIDVRMLPFSINLMNGGIGRVAVTLEGHVEWRERDISRCFAASLAVLIHRYCDSEAFAFILQTGHDERIVNIVFPSDEAFTPHRLSLQVDARRPHDPLTVISPENSIRVVVQNEVQPDIQASGLQLTLREEAGRVWLGANASASLFHADDLTRFLTQWEQVALHLRHWDGDVRHIPTLSELETKRTLALWASSSEFEPTQPISLIERFHRISIQYEQKRAVTDENESVTFGELSQRVFAIAEYLRARNITSGAKVAVHLTRSVSSVATLIALLDVGAIYIPVDPTYPSVYVNDILQICQPDIIVTNRMHADKLPPYKNPIIYVEDIAHKTEPRSIEHGRCATSEPFAILFTSGSTNKPKAVIHSQMPYIRRFEWMWSILPVGEDEVFAQRTSLGFGPHIWESLGGILQGAHTVIVSDIAGKDPERLLQLLALHRVTRVGFVPSLLRVILQSGRGLDLNLSHLRICSVAGEPLKESLYQEFKKALPHVQLYVDFGSTEINGIFFCDTNTRPAGETAFLLGRPMPRAHVFVLDKQQQPVPPGMPGDLYVGGESLALGYLKQDGRYEPVANQQISGVDSPLFNTGDRVRYLPDGRLVSLGRQDSQVKIRGMRVNLAQVELALGTLPSLRAVCVVVSRKRNGEARLVALVEVIQDCHVTHIYTAAHELLPQHMVPDEIRLAKALPRLPNGKINRRELERLVTQTDMEIQNVSSGDVALILRNLIVKIGEHRIPEDEDIDNTGIGALGIDSLAVTELALAITEHLEIDITPTQLFSCDTFGRLRRHVQQRLEGKEVSIETSDQLELDRLKLSTAVDNLRYAAELANDGASLITGATGFLGIHLLDELLRSSDDNMYCLIRATSQDAAWQIICKISLQYRLTVHQRRERITLVLGDITATQLGLSKEVYTHLAATVCRIFHCAATVNHVVGYSQLRPANVLGTFSILELAAMGRCKHIVFSSTIGVCLSENAGEPVVSRFEGMVENGAGIVSAYGQSKWLAEHLIWRYAARSGAQVSLFRIGEISGHSVTGLGRCDDIFHNAIKLFLNTAKVPVWADGIIDIVPIDFVSKVLVAAGLNIDLGSRVYHLTHPQPMPIEDFFRLVLPEASNKAIRLEEWRVSIATEYENNSESYLRGFSVLIHQGKGSVSLEAYFQPLKLQQSHLTHLLSQLAIKVPPIDRDLWDRYFKEFQQQGFLKLKVDVCSNEASMPQLRYQRT